MSGAAHLNYTEEKMKLNYHHRPIKFLLAIFFFKFVFFPLKKMARSLAQRVHCQYNDKHCMSPIAKSFWLVKHGFATPAGVD